VRIAQPDTTRLMIVVRMDSHVERVLGADVSGQKQVAMSMHEKTKQEQQQRSGAQQSASPKPSAHLPPIYDDGFARRAGEIIARAAAHMKDAVRRRGKPKRSP
jgi:hypothetical protein